MYLKKFKGKKIKKINNIKIKTYIKNIDFFRIYNFKTYSTDKGS